MATLRFLCVLVFTHTCIFAELIEYGGFEEGNYGDAWDCRRCHFTRVEDSYGGQYAVKVDGREADYAGPRQKVNLTQNAFYNVESYIKLLNDEEGSVQTRIELYMHQLYKNGTRTWKKFGNGPYVTKADGWRKVGGCYRVPNEDIEKFFINFKGPAASVSFLVDNVSMKLVPEMNSDWKDDANERIQQIRMADITVDIFIGEEYALAETEVKIQQQSSEFPFGLMVKADQILGEDEQKYRDFVSQDFWEWVTMANALKWKRQKDPDIVDNELPRQTADVLLAMGKKLRGHNVIWGIDKNLPTWILNMTADQVKAQVDTRVRGIVTEFNGSLGHWDVNNEFIAGHGDWFEQRTGDRLFSEKVFQNISAIDPNVQLFFNEFNVINGGATTDAYVDLVEQYKTKGLPLYGIGVQGHIHNGPPDILRAKVNLDKLATTGVPIWINEFDIPCPDMNERYDCYEDILTYLFSYPSIKGIILWSWHDNGDLRREGTNLAAGFGDDFQLNTAGIRVQQLVKDTWRTNQNIQPSSRSSNVSLRVFKGEYSMKVLHRGQIVLEKNVTVRDGGATVNLHAGSGINCVNRWSAESGVGNGKSVTVSCATDEVMTGCSSRTKDKSENRDGERFRERSTNKAICKAVNSKGSTAPVQAIARCCKGPSDLQCSYPPKQTTDPGDGNQISIPCTTPQTPAGCTCLAYGMLFDGSYPDMDTMSCVTQDGGSTSGSFGTAACCEASGLNCVTKQSARSGDNLGDETTVACDIGYAITGCNVYNDFGGTAGAYAGFSDSHFYCLAVNGKNRTVSNQGVIAVATCCRIGN